MSQKPKVYHFKSLKKLVERLRDDLKSQDYVLLYAYNGTGKTRLSMAFKDAGKKKTKRPFQAGDKAGQRLIQEEIQKDTLYFNAYTEDLFSWENDLQEDNERYLKINSDSQFLNIFNSKGFDLDKLIRSYLERYANFDFKINYEERLIRFFRDDTNFIKISRGEENIFIWCIFLAICELVIDDSEDYDWVKFLYIDDPISSLDDNNAIAVASDLALLLKKGKGRIRVVISSHHALFFNVMFNELKSSKEQCKKYFLYKGKTTESYSLRNTDETPFFHHVAMLSEVYKASESGNLFTYHFNMLRSIMEKTATFFGFNDFSDCLHGIEDNDLYARALNLLSHGKYSIFEPREMVQDNKELFKQILHAFLTKYKFELPELFPTEPNEVIHS